MFCTEHKVSTVPADYFRFLRWSSFRHALADYNVWTAESTNSGWFKFLISVLVRCRDRNGGDNEIYDPDGQYIDADGMLRATSSDANGTGEPSSSTSSVGVDSETVILSLKDRVRWLEQRLLEKVCSRCRRGQVVRATRLLRVPVRVC